VNMKIILIDDDRDDGEIFREVLSEIDSSILFFHFEDPQKALAELHQKNPGLPDLLFLDINMPVVSGWQCLTEIKAQEHLRNIPVIIYTTSSQSREKEIATELGASAFITKPDDYNELRQVLSAIVQNGELRKA
jgi:CheY-like chemotaxis protein